MLCAMDFDAWLIMRRHRCTLGYNIMWVRLILCPRKRRVPDQQNFTMHDPESLIQESPRQRLILSWCGSPCPPQDQGATSKDFGVVAHGLIAGSCADSTAGKRAERSRKLGPPQRGGLTQKPKNAKTLQDVGRPSHGDLDSLTAATGRLTEAEQRWDWTFKAEQ